MAKRVVWTLTARNQRREILEYWIKRNGNKRYSRRISATIRKRIKYLAEFNYLGKPTDFNDHRVTAAGHFSIFYKVQADRIIITSIWDNRQNPDDLQKVLE
jgi:plasmid stabilization system protein ParE